MPISVKFYSVEETAKLTGLPHKRILQLFSEGAFPSGIQYDGGIRIPLLDMKGYIKAANVPELRRYSLAKRQGAIQRFNALAKFEELRIKYRSGDQYRPDSYSEAARDCGLSRRSVERWRSRLRRYGLKGLVDSRGGGMRCKASHR
ncbi:MAG: helix-turn-helix domain-containing protein [Sedimentisphaerales bacterium]|nr:helix-turn-helix domain-containing protein [Sedimentisphaerales bacterium]